MSRLLDQVNILQGTDSRPDFSTGNTLPLTALPFGMNHWSPMTSTGPWFFDPHRRLIHGIRCTHQPSPWIGDYGAFIVMAQTGPLRWQAADRLEPWLIKETSLQPHHFRTQLPCDGTVIEMAPTAHGAVFRFRFQPGRPARIILQGVSGEGASQLHSRSEASSSTNGAAGGTPEGFCHHFAASFDLPPTSITPFTQEGLEREQGPLAGFIAEYDQAPSEVSVWIATSFISREQAWTTLHREVQPLTLEKAKQAAQEAWEQALSPFSIETDEPSQAATFASCLYRTQLFPRFLTEVDASGAERHWSPYSGRVEPGLGVTDNGFWDTHRTVYPLYSLTQRPLLAKLLQGWVASSQEGGWFPQWASPGYRACMVGTHIDAVFADAAVRGVTGYDQKAALKGLLKHAETPGDPAGAWGRIGVADYLRLGWVPSDLHHESVCRTLDYAYDDWCIAQFALAIGEEGDAQAPLARSSSWRSLYDPGVGFMRGRMADGSWEEPWDEFKWGSPYVEGGPWQALWAAPHDIPGLIQLLGGPDLFVQRLEALLTTPPEFRVGVYGTVIHEMTEMACAGFGQYAHSNQPVHHVLYLFAHAGRPDLTRKWVDRVQRELYSPHSLPGDEDNGEMAAWHVLSALGLFPTCPGRPAWTLGTPLFNRITLQREWAPDLVVEKGQTDSKPTLNGHSLDGPEISEAQVAAGGLLLLPSP
jgi:predicted alpha-1,2-mannosidase